VPPISFLSPIVAVMVEHLKRGSGTNIDESENLVKTHTLTGGGRQYTIKISQKSV